jgi:hypothetical protein
MTNFTIPGEVGVEDLLRALDEWAVQNDEKGRALWAVLTAMRGPDQKMTPDAKLMKQYTTGIVRRLALPRLARRVWADVWKGSLANYDDIIQTATQNVKDYKPDPDEDSEEAVGLRHFLAHVTNALIALRNAHRGEV